MYEKKNNRTLETNVFLVRRVSSILGNFHVSFAARMKILIGNQ